ncbi:MAG: ribokinase [Lactobacillaceae bacterium]|jgi:ribokinase|nr:ribokinase [Lactobacillaceae bacterium]
MNKIIVIGSLNIDVQQKIARLPQQGETLGILDQATNFGGKGANQAVAAARQTANVHFIGAVGQDERGIAFKDLLVDEGISTTYINEIGHKNTGTAYIMLEPDGHNTILVYPGANEMLTMDDVKAAEHEFADVDYVVAQLEVPQAAVLAGFRLAHKYGAKTILNPAPVTDHVDAALLAETDLVVPNETEAAALAHLPATTDAAELVDVMQSLRDKGVGDAIITLGEDGVYYDVAGQVGVCPIFKVQAVDTTAAGDTFIGTLAAHLALDNQNLVEAIMLATRASSLAVSEAGAISSIPTLADVEAANAQQ